MSKHLTITLNEWVVNEIIGEVPNKSAKIEELLIKGYMAEKAKASITTGLKCGLGICKRLIFYIKSRFLSLLRGVGVTPYVPQIFERI